MTDSLFAEILGLPKNAARGDVVDALRRAVAARKQAEYLIHDIARLGDQLARLDADNTSLRARLFAARIERDRARRLLEEHNQPATTDSFPPSPLHWRPPMSDENTPTPEQAQAIVDARQALIKQQEDKHGFVKLQMNSAKGDCAESIWAVPAEEPNRYYLCNVPLNFGCWGLNVLATSDRRTWFEMQDEQTKTDFYLMYPALVVQHEMKAKATG